jgi:RNA polymerase sigma-70 factor (ECF subfamily)
MAAIASALPAPDARLTPRRVRISDESLVREVLSGKEDTFETLLRRHESGVYAFLYRMTGDPDEAADVAQEVFMKTFANLEQFNPAFKFKTWLYRIAANAAVDRRRRRRRGPTAVAPPEEGGAGPALPSREPNPEEILQAKETRAKLEAALRKMSATYREVLLLRFQGDMRYDEIASVTGLPLGTVKNRIFRAREMLKRALP